MTDFGFDGIIFDLDGVVTKTASVHSMAWKKMFDEYLKYRAIKYNEEFIEFTHKTDYLPYVDGKPRYKGVDDFLRSRNIKLPYGNPEDENGKETVCGLGNRKNEAFNQVLADQGVEVYESTVELMKTLKEKGLRIGVASSSKNCENILNAAKLNDLVEVRIDGVVSAELGLNGKPEPDIFTLAAERLNLKYHRTVIVEDAESGVKAGKKGNFGLVLGLARENNAQQLYQNGADVVVADIERFSFKEICNWFKKGIEDSSWQLNYYDYLPDKEKTRESLLTTGNGYMGTRGSLEEHKAGQNHYPGTYVAGLYNKLSSKVGNRMVENEDFVNCPNWLPISFMIEGGNWFHIDDVEILEFKRSLNLKNGLLTRELIVQDADGNETRIIVKRFTSMDNPHLAAIQYAIQPINYNKIIILRSVLDGNIINDGVERYKSLNQEHLEELTLGFDNNISWLVSKTRQSGIKIAETSKLELLVNGQAVTAEILNSSYKHSVISEIEIAANQGQIITLCKTVALFTDKKDDVEKPLNESKRLINNVDDFDSLLNKSEIAWNKLWKEIDIKVTGDRQAQLLLRLHLYHLMVSMSAHNAKIDASTTARGLHGEAYRGHIFWDELFIQSFYNLHLPKSARAMLMYRYKRLEKARENARLHHYEGAMYPWQSGSDGREETQIVHLNPISGKWDDDYSSLQRHVSLAIAYNIWHYYNTTGDIKFLEQYGAEMFLEITRFWASKADFRASLNKFSISKVMGPDEFHEKYPDAEEGGLRDNAYTNIMASWVIDKSITILDLIDNKQKQRIAEKIHLEENELNFWKNISHKLNLVISDEGIIAQYDGYFDLLELDWDAYRKNYGNIYRLDRILKAEGKSPDDYKVAKQADTLMTFYNLHENQVSAIIKSMNYTLPDDYLHKNLEYYLARTSHGSTLSRVVHAQLATIIGDYKLSWELYHDALTSDVDDIQGGTTAEGIHLGVMAGTIMIAINTFAGIDIRNDILAINPKLPKHWENIGFSIQFKGVHYYFSVGKKQLNIELMNNSGHAVRVKVGDRNYDFDKKISIELN